jgi:serine/threonine protein kinase
MVVTPGPDWFIKITDFGISKRRQQDVTTLHTMQRGTFGFAAPEALGLTSDSTYTFSVDMWSVGAVAYKLLTNNTAFQNLADLFQYINGALEFPIPQLDSHKVSQHAQCFIVALMNAEPKERLSVMSAGKHPWMSTVLSCSSEGEYERYQSIT